VKIYPLEAE